MSNTDNNTKELNIDETVLDETINKDNDTTPKSSLSKSSSTPKKLRTKVKKDQPTTNEEKKYPVFFNITLIEDEPDINQLKEKKFKDTIQIMKEQETFSKLDAIISTSIATQRIMRKVNTSKDDNLLNSTDSNPSTIKKKSIKNKIEKPLKLKGHITEENLSLSIDALKKLTQSISLDELSNIPVSDLQELADTKSDEDLANLILEKTGRKKKSKKSTNKPLNEFKKDENSSSKKRQTP